MLQTAEMLTLFLVNKTDYFKDHVQDLKTAEQGIIAEICSFLLRHVAQLVCNAHAIVKLDSAENFPDSSKLSDIAVVSESQQRIATAIYPSASMMNHSCDPNIISRCSNHEAKAIDFFHTCVLSSFKQTFLQLLK